MGILGRDRPQQGSSAGSTLIGADTELVGDLTLNDNLHVDGRLQGNIESSADVTIGKSGHMDGEIRAQRVLVSGRVQGRIDADRLEIVAGGEVEGNVVTVDLVIEPGGRFNGSSEIRAEELPASSVAEPSKNDRKEDPKKDSKKTSLDDDKAPEGSSSPA